MMFFVGRDLKGHIFPTAQPWAGINSAKPGCRKLQGKNGSTFLYTQRSCEE